MVLGQSILSVSLTLLRTVSNKLGTNSGCLSHVVGSACMFSIRDRRSTNLFSGVGAAGLDYWWRGAVAADSAAE